MIEVARATSSPMRSSIRRSTPAIGEATHGSRAACTATRCEKSAFSSIDSLVRRSAAITLGEERRREEIRGSPPAHPLGHPPYNLLQCRRRGREIQPCEPGVIGTERFAKIQPNPRLVQKALLNKDGRHARASDTSGDVGCDRNRSRLYATRRDRR